MAITASGIFVQSFVDSFDGSQSIDLTAATHKIALFSGNTPVYATDTAYDTGNWASAQEISGTGWASGGVVLTSTAVTQEGDSMCFDAADVSETNTTLADSEGGLIYDDAATTPVADIGICGIYWGAGDFSTNAGTFAVTWTAPGATGGIFAIDLTP